jgi:hypothetical protein
MGVTLMDAVPVRPPADAVIVADPAATAVTVAVAPAPDTAAIDGSLEVQTTTPLALFGVSNAVSEPEAPMPDKARVFGVMATAATPGGFEGPAASPPLRQAENASMTTTTARGRTGHRSASPRREKRGIPQYAQTQGGKGHALTRYRVPHLVVSLAAFVARQRASRLDSVLRQIEAARGSESNVAAQPGTCIVH